jgi:hypothetical protein
MQLKAPDRRLHRAMKDGWARFVRAAHPRYRLALRRRYSAAAALNVAPANDPVALTVLAVNRLGPATLRSAANGRPVRVTVPSARVGEIFRAALAEMQKTRTTDRLIEIVIAGEGADAGRSTASV